MKPKNTNIMMHNTVFMWIALATGLILLVPLVAMQFSSEVDWDLTDFITVGVLLFGVSSMFVLTARKVNQKYWTGLGVLFALAIFYLWAELAVGIFTNLGS
jgi:hypothetical protein